MNSSSSSDNSLATLNTRETKFEFYKIVHKCNDSKCNKDVVYIKVARNFSNWEKLRELIPQADSSVTERALISEDQYNRLKITIDYEREQRLQDAINKLRKKQVNVSNEEAACRKKLNDILVRKSKIEDKIKQKYYQSCHNRRYSSSCEHCQKEITSFVDRENTKEEDEAEKLEEEKNQLQLKLVYSFKQINTFLRNEGLTRCVKLFVDKDQNVYGLDYEFKSGIGDRAIFYYQFESWNAMVNHYFSDEDKDYLQKMNVPEVVPAFESVKPVMKTEYYSQFDDDSNWYEWVLSEDEFENDCESITINRSRQVRIKDLERKEASIS